MLGFIGKWIKEGRISSATGRAIETGILSTLSAFIVGLLDNVDIIINGGTIDWQTFFIAFAASTALTLTQWMRKQARDIAKITDSELI